jgi:hypothetical protein
MNKQEIIYGVKNLLSPIDKTNRFHIEQIAVVCDLVYAQSMMLSGDNLMDDLDLFAKEYTAQTITKDATRNLYYATIPVDTLHIPNLTNGVRHVNTNQGQDMDFVPITEYEWNYMAGTEVQTTDTTIGFWRQGNKLWFDESMTSDIAAVGVRMGVLPRFREFADSDTIHIPGATDLQFMQQVVNVLAPSAPVDLKANNA